MITSKVQVLTPVQNLRQLIPTVPALIDIQNNRVLELHRDLEAGDEAVLPAAMWRGLLRLIMRGLRGRSLSKFSSCSRAAIEFLFWGFDHSSRTHGSTSRSLRLLFGLHILSRRAFAARRSFSFRVGDIQLHGSNHVVLEVEGSWRVYSRRGCLERLRVSFSSAPGSRLRFTASWPISSSLTVSSSIAAAMAWSSSPPVA